MSVLRCAFEFGYKDHPEKHNPAAGLVAFRIAKKDRPEIDPFTIQEGESIIATSHVEFGLAHGNYEEFRFFTGLRQSERIALTVADCDVTKGKIQITHARVLGREKDRTKTREDREIMLCPRALQILKRQLALRAQLDQAGKIDDQARNGVLTDAAIDCGLSIPRHAPAPQNLPPICHQEGGGGA